MLALDSSGACHAMAFIVHCPDASRSVLIRAIRVSPRSMSLAPLVIVPSTRYCWTGYLSTAVVVVLRNLSGVPCPTSDLEHGCHLGHQHWFPTSGIFLDIFSVVAGIGALGGVSFFFFRPVRYHRQLFESFFFFCGSHQDELAQPAHFTVLEITSRLQGSELSGATMNPRWRGSGSDM